MTTSTVASPAPSGRRRPPASPDFLIQGSREDNIFIVGPCHRAAAVWLHTWAERSGIWVSEGLSLQYHGVREFIADATRHGFTLRLPVQFDPRAHVVKTPELWVVV